MEMGPVVHPGDAEVGIGAVAKIELDPGSVLEVDHPRQAIRDALGMKWRARL